MRVRYLIRCKVQWDSDEVFHSRGDISILPDEQAMSLINDKFAEPFSYSIPDKDILSLHQNQNDTSEFEEKVNILMEVLSREIQEILIEANPGFLLEDRTFLSFKVIPKLPSEWFYYNSRLSELYKKKYSIFSVEDLMNEFNQSLINFPYLIKLKEDYFESIRNIIEVGVYTG